MSTITTEKNLLNDIMETTVDTAKTLNSLMEELPRSDSDATANKSKKAASYKKVASYNEVLEKRATELFEECPPIEIDQLKADDLDFLSEYIIRNGWMIFSNNALLNKIEDLMLRWRDGEELTPFVRTLLEYEREDIEKEQERNCDRINTYFALKKAAGLSDVVTDGELFFM